MEYHININGADHTLPVRTVELDGRIANIQNIKSRICYGEVSLREARKEQYDFIVDCIGEPLPPLEEIDVTELELSALEIVNAYHAPEAKAKVDAAMGTLKEIFERPEFAKFVTLLGKRPQ